MIGKTWRLLLSLSCLALCAADNYGLELSLDNLSFSKESSQLGLGLKFDLYWTRSLFYFCFGVVMGILCQIARTRKTVVLPQGTLSKLERDA